MMKIVTLFTLCCILQLPAFAKTEKCERRFRVSVNAYKPLYSVDSYGQLSGVSYDVVKELEKRFGCFFQQDPTEIPRMIENLKNWRADIIAFFAKSDSLDQYGSFVELYTVNRRFVLQKDFFVKGKKVSEYLSDPKIKITNQIGAHPFITDAELDILKSQNRLVQIPSPEVSYQMIRDGRVQGFFSSAILHNYFLNQFPSLKGKVIGISDPNVKIPIGLYLSKKRVTAEEKEGIRKTIEEMRDDGTLRMILLKYMSEEDLKDYQGVPERTALLKR